MRSKIQITVSDANHMSCYPLDDGFGDGKVTLSLWERFSFNVATQSFMIQSRCPCVCTHHWITSRDYSGAFTLRELQRLQWQYSGTRQYSCSTSLCCMVPTANVTTYSSAALLPLYCNLAMLPYMHSQVQGYRQSKLWSGVKCRMIAKCNHGTAVRGK